MSRCIGCNKELTKEELMAVKSDGSPEDLCDECKEVIKDAEDIYLRCNFQDGDDTVH